MTNSNSSGDHFDSPRLRQGLVLSRILFGISIILSIIGGIMKGNPAILDPGIRIVKAGYVLFACFVVILTAFAMAFWINRSTLSRLSLTVGPPSYISKVMTH